VAVDNGGQGELGVLSECYASSYNYREFCLNVLATGAQIYSLPPFNIVLNHSLE
jgi:hypothetical protein